MPREWHAQDFDRKEFSANLVQEEVTYAPAPHLALPNISDAHILTCIAGGGGGSSSGYGGERPSYGSGGGFGADRAGSFGG
jgi:hypothetical protein